MQAGSPPERALANNEALRHNYGLSKDCPHPPADPPPPPPDVQTQDYLGGGGGGCLLKGLWKPEIILIFWPVESILFMALRS